VVSGDGADMRKMHQLLPINLETICKIVTGPNPYQPEIKADMAWK
jgi:hypothetical protein